MRPGTHLIPVNTQETGASCKFKARLVLASSGTARTERPCLQKTKQNKYVFIIFQALFLLWLKYMSLLATCWLFLSTFSLMRVSKQTMVALKHLKLLVLFFNFGKFMTLMAFPIVPKISHNLICLSIGENKGGITQEQLDKAAHTLKFLNCFLQFYPDTWRETTQEARNFIKTHGFAFTPRRT